MAARGYVSHYSPVGASAFDMLNSSGCAWGQAAVVIERNNLADKERFWFALRELAASAAHYWLIVGDYRVVGAALVRGTEGRSYTVGIFVRGRDGDARTPLQRGPGRSSPALGSANAR